MDNNISEARRMYSARIERDFTQQDAAEHFGVSLSAYRKWEQGHGKMNGEQLSEIADFYGVSCDYLLCRTVSPAPVVPSGLSTTEKAIVDAYRNGDFLDRALIERAAGVNGHSR